MEIQNSIFWWTLSDFRGEGRFIPVMQTRWSSTCPISVLQKFKCKIKQPGTRLRRENGKKRAETAKKKKKKDDKNQKTKTKNTRTHETAKKEKRQQKQKQKTHAHMAREESRAVDWEGEWGSFSGRFQWLNPLFCRQRRFPISLCYFHDQKIGGRHSYFA